MPWYNTKDGITFREPCPLEEEINTRYAAAEKGINRLDIIHEVKKSRNFPIEVTYVPAFKERPSYLMVEASSAEEAEQILMNNKGVIENIVM